jgi:hypothetical protein
MTKGRVSGPSVPADADDALGARHLPGLEALGADVDLLDLTVHERTDLFGRMMRFVTRWE